MNYPTIEEVNNASHWQICQWYRFLPTLDGFNPKQEEILNLICKKWKEGGGFTPEISKSVGWSTNN